jgi:hypothetical protein
MDLSVSQEELMYIQSQLEGLESIFLELMPFGVELKRQQVQDYYDKRFDQATKPTANVAETELRRQFNTKANQVRNLVDSAESLGDAGNKLNLIRAAATLPENRSKPLKGSVGPFCHKLLYESAVEKQALSEIMSSTEIGVTEARVILGSICYLVVDELEADGSAMPVKDLLGQILNCITSTGVLQRNDPFYVEAQCALEAMKE